MWGDFILFLRKLGITKFLHREFGCIHDYVQMRDGRLFYEECKKCKRKRKIFLNP